jgi:dipeptide/tripeptide permease
MKKVTAATLINIFNGTTNMAPLLGAFLSDSYFGRYKTLAFASMSSLLVIWMIFLSFLDRISHVCISILDPRP